jgi:Plasmid encoded RepA protein
MRRSHATTSDYWMPPRPSALILIRPKRPLWHGSLCKLPCPTRTPAIFQPGPVGMAILTLTIRSGWDHERGSAIGYPYGTLPRLLLFWMITEAVKTKNRRLELGGSLASFMRQLGLDPSRGGKRSDAIRLRDQMRRLFQASISFHQTREEKGRKGEAWMNRDVAPDGVLWWDEKQPEQAAFWSSWRQ